MSGYSGSQMRHALLPDLHDLVGLGRADAVELVDELVVLVVVPAREVDEVAAGDLLGGGLVEPQRVVDVRAVAAAVAEEGAGVVAGGEAVEDVGRLGVGRLDPGPLELLDDDRTDAGEVEEADDLELDRLRRFRPATCRRRLWSSPWRSGARRPSPGCTPGTGTRSISGWTASRNGCERRVVGHEEGRGEAGAQPGDVDDLLAVEVVADRPADVRVVVRRHFVVEVERVRPPVDVAERRLLAGPGGDLVVPGEDGRRSSPAGCRCRCRTGWR